MSVSKGCDSGFGYQLVQCLSSYGFRVYATVLDTHSYGAQQLIDNCSEPNRMVVHKMDVTRARDIENVYQKVVEDLQTNDYILWSVVNNVGYGVIAQTEWLDLAQIKKLFEVNLFGVVKVTRMFLPLIRHSKGIRSF